MVNLGVDVGGTNVKVGAVDNDGNVLFRLDNEIKDKNPDQVISLIVSVANQVLNKLQIQWNDIECIGICFPGQIENGMVIAAANFPTWDCVPVEKRLIEATSRPTTLFNDGNAAISAEIWIGAGKRGLQNFVMITLGTGIGMGVVINGTIVEGSNGLMEGGHMVCLWFIPLNPKILVPNGRQCGCTQRGCLEMYTSASALVTQAESCCKSESGRESNLLSKFPLTAKKIFDAAEQGDQVAIQVIDEVADYLAIACLNIARLLDPQAIVFSGGMANAGAPLLDKVNSRYKTHAWTKFPNNLKIVKSEVGYDSGIIGVVALAKSKTKTK